MYAHIKNMTWKEKGHQSAWGRMVFIQYLMTQSTDATSTANSPETQTGWVSQPAWVCYLMGINKGNESWVLDCIGVSATSFHVGGISQPSKILFGQNMHIFWMLMHLGKTLMRIEVDILMTTYWRSRRVSDMSQVHLSVLHRCTTLFWYTSLICF